MSNITTQQKSAVQFFEQPAVRTKFESMLGKRAPQFITSVLQIVNGSNALKKCDPITIYTAAATAATLDLPVNNNLGFAYIVPYKGQAQFQLGAKGYIQLAQRSGQYKNISVTEVFDGQIAKDDPLRGIEFDWSGKKSDKVIGYAAYFSLVTGFEKTLYMTKEDIQNHARKYSQSFKMGSGVWKDDFDAMAKKTVLKLLISKYGPLSVEMQTATITDQAVIKDLDTMEVEYADNMEVKEDPQHARALALIEDATTAKQLDDLHTQLGDDYAEFINAKREQL